MWQNRGMRFRLGLMIGAGAGYVLGAKAGRGRYEQIRRVTDTVRSGEIDVTKLLDAVTNTLGKATGAQTQPKAG